MNNIKVSVIVPIYNVEKYIDKCLNSLVQQTLSEIEIIAVNDGSPDRSQDIIDRYVEKYPGKVVSFIKQNGGLSDARNYGIRRAQGEYIGFVDSDDWVEPEMFRSMYEFAKKESLEVVLCDLIQINDGWEKGTEAKGYRGDMRTSPIPKYEYILNSLNPAMACNKLFKRTLFDIKQFPTQWYEDMATTPILLSHADQIGYLPRAFYYYRQVEQSITKLSGDRRTLQVMDAWDACLREVQADFLEPMEAAVYRSVQAFLSFKPEFARDFLGYIRRNEAHFRKNPLIREDIRNNRTEDLFAKQLIPRKIHYFWFGGNPKSELIQRCIESWRRYAPDFEIIEWNESNCDLHVNKYVEQAYAAKKWAFVSDYFRMEKIAEYGGIYFDTDVELMREPSRLLLDSAFFAFETKNAVHAGAFGAVPNHPILDHCRKSYMKNDFVNKDGTYNTNYTVVRRITEQLDRHGVVLNGVEQVLDGGVRIYPANKLTLDMFDGEIIAQHHYDCSWWAVKVGVQSYKHTVLRDYFAREGALTMDYMELLAQRDFYQRECERYENSTCWKITKPLRMIVDWMKKLRDSVRMHRL